VFRGVNPGFSVAQSQAQNPHQPTVHGKSTTVTDSCAVNSKELLNAYIYDYLLKSGFNESAMKLFQEAGIPVVSSPGGKDTMPSGPAKKEKDSDADKGAEKLPHAKMTMDTPQGFLYEWWMIFWDVFNARTERGGSANAQRYYQYLDRGLHWNQNGHPTQGRPGFIPVTNAALNIGIPQNRTGSHGSQRQSMPHIRRENVVMPQNGTPRMAMSQNVPNGNMQRPPVGFQPGSQAGVQAGLQSGPRTTPHPGPGVQLGMQPGIQAANQQGIPFQPGVTFAQQPHPAQGSFNVTQQQIRMQQQMLANAQRLAKSKVSNTTSGDRKSPKETKSKGKNKAKGKGRSNGGEGRSKAGNTSEKARGTSKRQARSSNRSAHTGSMASSRNSSNTSKSSTGNTNASSISGNGAAAAAAAASLSSNLKALSSNLKNGSQKSHRPQNLHGLHRVGSMNVTGPMSAPASGISPRDTTRMMTDFSPISGHFSQGDTGGSNTSGMSSLGAQASKSRTKKLSRSVPATPLTSGGSMNTLNKRKGGPVTIQEGQESLNFTHQSKKYKPEPKGSPAATENDDFGLDFDATPNDIFDFNTLLGAEEDPSSSNSGLKEVFNWGDTMSSHEL